MKVIADMHIHSSHSRACSKDLSLENLEKYARIKGIGLLGTGDFTHPKWVQEIKSKLREN
ncbi:TPA: DNA helicase UvrD, partial [Candidatus Woesearchaeota archaeon]|nr:DNA helicase UvrD [Candidatus Woesearchaeota archaeon]